MEIDATAEQPRKDNRLARPDRWTQGVSATSSAVLFADLIANQAADSCAADRSYRTASG